MSVIGLPSHLPFLCLLLLLQCGERTFCQTYHLPAACALA